MEQLISNKRPTFIGIGAQKSATTWLYDLLKLHPSVSLSAVKEIHFFSHYYEYGFQWYESHFEDCSSDKELLGEFSTSYFSNLSAPFRISQAYPNAKLILMLREPIERLISNHKHEIRTGHYCGPDLSIEAGIRNNPSYIEQGLYANHLERWLEYFDLEDIHIVIFDEVKSSPEMVEKKLYQFLGLKPLQNTALLSKSNSSYFYRFKTAEQLRRNLLGALRKIGLESVYRGMVKKTGLQSAYRRMNRSAADEVVPPMLGTTYQELQEVFSEQIMRLQDMTGIDLNNWTRAK